MRIRPVVVQRNDREKIVLIPVPLVNRPNLFLLRSNVSEPAFVEVPDDAVCLSYSATPRNRATTSAILLVLNEMCNLACPYCFEYSATRSNQRLSEQQAFCAIDFVIRNAMAQGAKDVFISLFGGEPTLSFNLIKRIVTYAREQCSMLGLKARIGGT